MKSLMKNKKAGLMDIIIWVVSAFLIVVILGFWIYLFAQLTGALTSIPTQAGAPNISDIAHDVIVPVNDAMRNFEWISFAMIFAMAIAIFVFNYYTHRNAAFFWLYILMVIMAVVISVPLSNTYESLLTDNVIGSTLTGLKASSFVILYLPLWTTVIGIFGAIFLFIGIQRDKEGGVGL